MEILIQKYGGTSVASQDNRRHVIQHIKQGIEKNLKIVAVVSAMGRAPAPYATDTLLSLVDHPNNYNTEREIDLLMSSGEILSAIVLSNELQREGIHATVLTGGQAGIITTNDYNQAKIKEVRTTRILNELQHLDVVIVAGFQGQTESGEITTIGRGGSDTTAAALGASLLAQGIEVFTDVSGIMTADPRLVEKAKHLEVVTYTEISNLAIQGAKVIHPRAIEIAMQSEIPINIRSTYTNEKGTLITTKDFTHVEGPIPERPITGITHVDEITQIKIILSTDVGKHQAIIFKAMADANISVDFISVSPTYVIYTVTQAVTEQALSILNSLGYNPSVIESCAKVSAVGAGMTGVPGITSRIVGALTNEDIDILQFGDSHTTIWVLIHDKDLKVAVNALHDAFELSAQHVWLQ